MMWHWHNMWAINLELGLIDPKTLSDAIVNTVGLDDPMVLVRALRSHLFHTSKTMQG